MTEDGCYAKEENNMFRWQSLEWILLHLLVTQIRSSVCKKRMLN